MYAHMNVVCIVLCIRMYIFNAYMHISNVCTYMIERLCAFYIIIMHNKFHVLSYCANSRHFENRCNGNTRLQ